MRAMDIKKKRKLYPNSVVSYKPTPVSTIENE